MAILIAALAASYILPLSQFFYLRSLYKNDPERKKECGKLLLRGVATCVPVFFFSLASRIIFNVLHLGDAGQLVADLFMCFVTYALSEEWMKYLATRKALKKFHSKISYLDVIAFSCIPGIGFEILESIFYFFGANVPQILVRGLSNMHAVFGLIVGLFIAKGYKKGQMNAPVLAIACSTFVHGLYDFGIRGDNVETWLGGVSLALAIACFIASVYLFFWVKKMKKDPYYTDPLFPEEAAEAPLAEEE